MQAEDVSVSADGSVTLREGEFKEELISHLDSMYRLAFSLAKNARDAEDLSQEATLKALKHWKQFKPGTNMRAWLLAIVRNGFINRYRRQRSRPTNVEFDDVEPFLSTTQPRTEDQQYPKVRNDEHIAKLTEQVDEEVKRALNELSPDFRETFLLAVVEDLTYKEIAAILDVPGGTVMSRLFRARKQMAQKLEYYSRDKGWVFQDNPSKSRDEDLELVG